MSGSKRAREEPEAGEARAAEEEKGEEGDMSDDGEEDDAARRRRDDQDDDDIQDRLELRQQQMSSLGCAHPRAACARARTEWPSRAAQ